MFNQIQSSVHVVNSEGRIIQLLRWPKYNVDVNLFKIKKQS